MKKREEYAGGISTYLVGYYCLDCAKDHPIDFEYLPQSMDFETKLSICAKNYFKYYDTGLGWKKIPCPFSLDSKEGVKSKESSSR